MLVIKTDGDSKAVLDRLKEMAKEWGVTIFAAQPSKKRKEIAVLAGDSESATVLETTFGATTRCCRFTASFENCKSCKCFRKFLHSA